MPAFFNELKDVRKAIAEFAEVKALFEELASAPINTDSGDVLTAVKEAQALIAQASEHHVVIELAIKELVDPKTASSEFQRLLAQANDNKTELGKFLNGAKGLVGGEFQAVTKIISDRQVK